MPFLTSTARIRVTTLLLASLSVLAVSCGTGAGLPPEGGNTPPAGETAGSPEAARRTIASAFYRLDLTTHTGLVPPPDRPRAGGALAAMNDGFLLATAAGDLYRLSWTSGTLAAERLPRRVPFNRVDLLKTTTPELAAPFRITDILVDERADPVRVLVAHHHFNADANCVTLRVSATTLSAADATQADTGWRTVFDTRPCLTVGETWSSGEAADRGGGRLALIGAGDLLLSVGDYGFDGLGDKPQYPQMPEVSYGKILLLDGAGGAVPYSLGHRNPQGLTVDRQGRIWSTEHGPEGGDELNLIVRGGNYGWPFATYGTAYDSDVWPLATDPASHGRFREPAQAFVPAVGISQLTQIGGDYLPRWSGDLLVSSLQAAMLFRIHLAGDRAIYTERMDVAMRVRDIAEGRDGRILIWNDAGEIASLLLAP